MDTSSGDSTVYAAKSCKEILEQAPGYYWEEMDENTDFYSDGWLCPNSTEIELQAGMQHVTANIVSCRDLLSITGSESDPDEVCELEDSIG